MFVDKKSSYIPAFLLLFGLFWAILLAGCTPSSMLVNAGLLEAAVTPDTFVHYRGLLQPTAQQDIELAAPLPRYHITARLADNRENINGVMQVTVDSPGPELVFRLYPAVKQYGGTIEITQAQINGQSVDTTLLADNTAIRLNVPTNEGTLPATATAALAFTTRLPQSSTVPALFGWRGPVLSLPGFFPMLAAAQEDGWALDVPPLHGDVLFSQAALYQLDITLPPEMVIAAGGVTLNLIDNADRSRTWQLAGGPLRDMTIVAGPFQSVSESAAGATVTSYYLPGNQAAGLTVLAHAAASLRLYSELYGPYPYTKLDVAEAPLGLRGMEYSGLILIGDEHYRQPQEFLTFLVAHEVAHQWWYAVVGNNPYRHPWLDEGIAEYSAFDYYRGVFGQSAAENLLVGRWQLPFNSAAGGNISGAIDRPAADFDPVSYELLVYSKAALFFNALRQQLGEEGYRQALQTYYRENRYQIATPQTFLDTVERVSGQNLEPLVEKWLK